MELVKAVYKETNFFPKTEIYGLTRQIRRSAISIPCNISEGAAGNSSKDFIRYLSIAQGSLSELDTQLDIAIMLQFLTSEKRSELDQLMIRVDKMLYSLIRSVRE